eukprot:TRINITY_DN9034_c0_g1_i1.p1 TRINITY_DN9034_c0_g1~~TRINITY_DN9034_c0_g1_i1.p1  ORF type:complete len:887 (+),score=206.85 TRINITY_DN9034_c0_g1_i1:65-2662(+)
MENVKIFLAVVMGVFVGCVVGQATSGDEAIRSVLLSTLKDGLEIEIEAVGTALEGIQFSFATLGAFFDDGNDVDTIVRVLEEFCDTSGFFNRLSTTAAVSGEHIVVYCTPANASGYWNIESSGRLVGVKFPHTTSTPLLEYYILDELPGGIKYSWPNYGQPTSTTTTQHNISSSVWYPQGPIQTTLPSFALTAGMYYISKPMCKTSTVSTAPTRYDTPANCPRFTGVIGLAAKPDDIVKFLKLVTPQSARVMVTTATGLALATSVGPIDYAMNSSDSETRTVATDLVQQGFAQGLVANTSTRWVYTKEYTHPAVMFGSPLWTTVSTTQPAAIDIPTIRSLAASNIVLSWQNMIKTSLAALGKLEQLLEEDSVEMTSADARDVRKTDQIIGYLVRVCKLYAGSVRAVHVTDPTGSFYYALCPVNPTQTDMKLAVRHVSQPSKLLSTYDYNTNTPLKAYPSWGTPTTVAYDPTNTSWFAAGLPVSNPSLAVVISEPQALLLQGEGFVLTKPRCSFNGLQTAHDTVQCPRFQGLISLEITNAQVQQLVQGPELLGNGYAFTVSPQGLVTDSSLKPTRTVGILNGNYTVRQTSGDISGDAYFIDVVDLVPVSGVLRVKSSGWKLVTLLYSGDVDAADLPTLHLTSIARSVELFLAGSLFESVESLNWLGEALVSGGVSLTENSTVDAVVSAQMWSCEYFPNYEAFYSSSPVGNLQSTACAFAGGRAVTIQNTSNANQETYILDKHPGVQGTSTYLWDHYGPLATSKTWSPSDERWNAKAQANLQSTAAQWTTYVPQIANPETRAPVTFTNVSTSAIERPYCMNAQGRVDAIATTCTSLVGWVAGDVYLTMLNDYLRTGLCGWTWRRCGL